MKETIWVKNTGDHCRGGASGLAAAIAAAENGAAVTLLEQNENPGRKICVTGNGRCNLTNRDMRPDIFRGQHPEFVEEILAQFTLEDTLAFLKNLGWLLQNVMDGCIPEAIRRNVFGTLDIESKSFKGQNQNKGTCRICFMGEWTMEGRDFRMDL